MSWLLQVALINAATATVLALLVAVASRFIRRPSLVHFLWLMVLAKLVTPPILPVGVIPTELVDPTPVLVTIAQPPIELAEMVPVEAPGTPTASRSWGDRLLTAALGLWAAGTGALLLLAALRLRRFRRHLRAARPAGGSLQRAAEEVATRMGLARCPRITLVPARVSPMLWWRGGAVELLFPAALLDVLTDGERDALLAHELAHVRRHDHWVRFLEMGTVAAFWWHPVTWWARSRLRRAEERSCDAWVVRVERDRPRSYATALLKTVSFLSGHEQRVPALASGVGEVQQLEERLTMILRPDSTRLLSRPRRLAFAGACLAVILIFPTWAERRQAADPERSQEEIEFREAQLQLERAAADLEDDLRAIRRQQRELQAAWMAEVHARELDRLRDEARTLEDSGDASEAEALRRQADALERRIDLQRDQERLAVELDEVTARMERPLQQIRLEIEELEMRGEHERADELRAEARALERELVERQAEREVSLRQMERDLRVAELQESAAQMEELRRAGRLEEALRMERELAWARRKLEHEEQRVRRKEEYMKLKAHAEQLAAEGRDQEAMELKRQLYEEEKRTRMKIEYKKLTVAIEKLRAQERHEEADELELRLQEIRDLMEDSTR